MDNTTYIEIAKTLKIYNEIYNEYNDINNDTSTIKTIASVKLYTYMPVNLKTPVKIKLFKSFGSEVTEKQFVELLTYQTSGADLINLEYIRKYYNLEKDTNGMLIWTEECPYTAFKQEAVNNWYIWSTLTHHPMFSKYMDDILEFKLQSRLEYNIFPTQENFRDDLCFIKANLINSTNEKQHYKKSQKILDAEKIALNKMNGYSVISFYTTAMVDIDKIKKTIYTNVITGSQTAENNSQELKDILQIIYTACNISDIDKPIVRLQTLLLIRSYFKIKPLKAQKNNISKFQKLENSYNVSAIIIKTLNNYFKIINVHINAAIKDSHYLKCYTSTLLDILLNACLNYSEFRQEYNQISLIENLVDYMQTDLVYLSYIKNVIRLELPSSEYEEIYNNKIKTFSNLYNIASEFIGNNIEFTNLFILKLKSLRDISNINVITFKELLLLFSISESGIQEFRIFINNTCCIQRYLLNAEVLLSWKQLQIVIFTYNNKPLLQRILMLYYVEIDYINEIIINRLQADANRFKCTKDNFNNYTGRITKKFTTVINKYKTALADSIASNVSITNLVNKLEGTSLKSIETMPNYNLVEPQETVCEDILGFKLITMPDAEKLQRVGLSERLTHIDSKLEILNSENNENNDIKNNSNDQSDFVDLNADFVDPDEDDL